MSHLVATEYKCFEDIRRTRSDGSEYWYARELPSLEGKKMFLYLAPKKAGAAKKSQQALDREKKAAEQKEAPRQKAAETADDALVEIPANGGLFANAKMSDAVKEKIKNIKE